MDQDNKRYQTGFLFNTFSVLVTHPHKIEWTHESEEFLCQPPMNWDYEIDINVIPNDIQPIEEGNWVALRFYSHDGKIIDHYDHPGGKIMARTRWISSHRAVIEFPEHQLNRIPSTFYLLNFLRLEDFFLKENSLILHSSFIEFNQEGILFSGPSGIGKSTQAALWEELMHAEVLNGDRTRLFFMDEKLHAGGMPYAGSSAIRKNRHCPVKAIVFLKQAQENSIRQLTRKEAMVNLYSQTTVHASQKHFVEQIMNLLMRIVETVPILELSCTPDHCAIETLQSYLDKSF